MDLDPGAVQLPLERRLAQLGERVLHGLGGAGEHRQHRPEELHRESRQSARAFGQCGAGNPRKVAGQHRGAANVVGGQAGRPGHGLDHDPFERALAKLAHDEAEQETPLFFAEPREQLAEDPLLGLGGSLARRPGDSPEGGVQLAELDGLRRVRALGRYRRGGGRGLKPGPADAELVLGNDAAEVGGGELDLVGGRGREHGGEAGDLLASARAWRRPRGRSRPARRASALQLGENPRLHLLELGVGEEALLRISLARCRRAGGRLAPSAPAPPAADAHAAREIDAARLGAELLELAHPALLAPRLLLRLAGAVDLLGLLLPEPVDAQRSSRALGAMARSAVPCTDAVSVAPNTPTRSWASCRSCHRTSCGV